MLSVVLFVGYAALFTLSRIYRHGDHLFALLIAGVVLLLGLAVSTIFSWYLGPDDATLFIIPHYLAWVLFGYGPVVLLGIAWIAKKWSPLARGITTTAGVLLIIIGIYVFFIEPYNLEVSTYSISSEKITEPIRVAVVSDIQTDNPGSYERRVFEMLKAQEPDLVLMTGDYVQTFRGESDSDALRDLMEIYREVDLNVPMGVYAVEGDSDYNPWPFIMPDYAITPMDGTINRDDVGELALTSLSLWDSSNSEISVNGSEDFHIVFGHRPDFALGEIEADLLIAGHVHGGQVQFPLIGPIVTMTRVPKSWVNGDLIALSENKHLVVSRGIGMERGEAPRMRFLCRPQLVIIDLLPAN